MSLLESIGCRSTHYHDTLPKDLPTYIYRLTSSSLLRQIIACCIAAPFPPGPTYRLAVIASRAAKRGVRESCAVPPYVVSQALCCRCKHDCCYHYCNPGTFYHRYPDSTDLAAFPSPGDQTHWHSAQSAQAKEHAASHQRNVSANLRPKEEAPADHAAQYCQLALFSQQ